MFSVDPYLTRQYDPHSYHCWHLVRDAWLELTGIDLGKASERRQLELVDQPVTPCVVIMIRPGEAPHAGLFRNGRVLHIHREGAKFERLSEAVLGHREVRYYAARHTDKKPAGPARGMEAG